MAVPASAPESLAPTALAVEPDPDLPRPATLEDVPGWFPVADHRLFCWLLEHQQEQEISGDVLEVGVYLGRSAIVLGRHLRAGETFTVCDLFESEAPDSDLDPYSAAKVHNHPNPFTNSRVVAPDRRSD